MWWTNKKSRMLIKIMGLIFVATTMLILIAGWRQDAVGAPKTYTFTTTIAAAPVVTMGTPIPVGTLLNYSIVDTGNQSNINSMTFTVPANYFLDPAIAGDYPLGWQASNPGGGSTITFTYVGPGGSTILKNSGNTQTFILRLRSNSVPSLVQDGTVTPSSVKATWANGHAATTYSTGNARLANSAWSVRSLAIISLTAVDSVTGLPSTQPGGTIVVTLTVANNSTGTANNVNISIARPTATLTVTTPPLTGNWGANPGAMTIPPGTSYFTWNYSLAGYNCPSAGSVFFKYTNVSVASAPAGFSSQPGTFTSVSVPIGCFTGSIALTPTCLLSGAIATVTMTLKNEYVNDITGVTATIVPGGTAPGKTLVPGFPTYSNTTITANGGTITVTWKYTITGAFGQTYFFTAGVVQGTLLGATVNANVASLTQGSILTPLVIAPSPNTVPSDKNQMVDVSWTFTNTVCNPVNQVAISIPAGWIVSTTGGTLDASALITYPLVSCDDWIVNPAGAIITFTAGTNTIAVNGNATFTIFFSQVPTAQATYTFPVVVTDSVLGNLPPVNTTIDVVAAAGSGINPAGLWGEQVR
jgi:hypothetical protein